MDLLKNMSLKELQDKKKKLETEIEMLDQEFVNRPKIQPMSFDECEEMQRALNRLWRSAEKLSPETNGRFIPNQDNYIIYYDTENRKFLYDSSYLYQYSILPYFLNTTLVKEFISENEADLRILFRVKR